MYFDRLIIEGRRTQSAAPIVCIGLVEAEKRINLARFEREIALRLDIIFQKIDADCITKFQGHRSISNLADLQISDIKHAIWADIDQAIYQGLSLFGGNW